MDAKINGGEATKEVGRSRTSGYAFDGSFLWLGLCLEGKKKWLIIISGLIIRVLGIFSF